MEMNDELDMVVSRPKVSDDLAKEILKEYFNFDATNLKDLVSYVDKNVFFKVSNEGPDISPHGYVLKILNEAGSLNSKFIDGINKMIIHIDQTVLPSTIPIKNIYGEYMFYKSIPCSEEDGEGELKEGNCLVRVLKFIPGTLLKSVPFTEKLFFHCGAMAAQVTKSLISFSNEEIENTKCIWSVEYIPSLCKLLYLIDDVDIQNTCKGIIDEFEEKVSKQLKNLPRVIIHGDLNEQNILVDKCNIGEEYKWSGILDFGDVNCSYVVFEVSILIAHLMYVQRATNTLDIGGHCLAGYLTNHKLSKLEMDMIPMCIKGRMLQAAVVGNQTLKKDPENDYVKEATENGWKLLRILIDCDEDEIMKRWRSIIAEYNVEIPN